MKHLGVFFFWPETAGRTLEEVDNIFLESKTIFDPVRVAKRMPRNIHLQVSQDIHTETATGGSEKQEVVNKED